MIHSPATVLAIYLRSLEPVTIPASAWSIYISAFPDKPDSAICVYDEEGKHDGRYMRTGQVVEHPGVQIRVRAMSYPIGWSKIQTIKEALDAMQNVIVVVDGVSYRLQSISRKTGCLVLGQEPGTRREHFVLNLTMTIRSL